MDDERDLTTTRIAAVHMTFVWAARRRADGRVKAFAKKYAPILADLSETEFCGLILALGAEGDKRTEAGGREEPLFRENSVAP